MARFFVDELPAEGAEYRLTGENAAHAKVLRLRPGEAVTLCDGRGTDCPCTVTEGLTLLAGPALPCPAEPKTAVSLWLAFPKADKAEHVIQKAVELGAVELVFFPSRYCVSRPEGKALENKLERWRRIARSAAEQSRRGVVPPVRAVGSYAQALREAAKAELSVLFYENEENYGIREALAEEHVGTSIACPRTSNARPYIQNWTVSLMTGAEGGFSEEEIEQARQAGLRICTLGPRILRCETAPLAGLTAVMYAMGEI
ncbi:MAG: 16S rRNA (uracil(1498)-N(3))-methyltransferase [Oscillospiraceae bacterium]|nr:16S rRNA (uracil(1498)-N(3))-methyltransferase [Oscillospiraceae bacterium]